MSTVLIHVDGELRRAEMARARHRTDAECPLCLEVAPLLMPVRICSVSVEPDTIHLCYRCRTGWRDDQWAVLASTIEHSAVRDTEPLEVPHA